MKFRIKGKVHYGWARLNVAVGNSRISATLTGYAYETIAGKSIKAGQTKEAENPNDGDFVPGASLTNPIPDKLQPATLDLLALGAPGLSVWRREEIAAPKHAEVLPTIP